MMAASSSLIENCGKCPHSSVRTAQGGFRALHQALLQSRSEFAMTKKNPGRLAPQDGEVSVLEGDSFGGQFISCGYAFETSKISHCSISL